ncbi:MAG: PIN domain-containing protein [Trueperaceae bacterium]
MSARQAKVLADTNVWIAFFRGSRASEQDRLVADVLDRLIVEDRVLTCGIVEMELLQGLRQGERATLQENFASLPFLDTTRDDFRRAGEISRQLRVKGTTIPSGDALIAAICIRRELALLENDRHFREIEDLKQLDWR